MSNNLHPHLEDKEYWELRLSLLSLQEKILEPEPFLHEVRDVVETLHNYLNPKEDPWDLN